MKTAGSLRCRCPLLDGEAVGGDPLPWTLKGISALQEVGASSCILIAPNMKQILRVLSHPFPRISEPRNRNLNCIEPLNSISSHKILSLTMFIREWSLESSPKTTREWYVLYLHERKSRIMIKINHQYIVTIRARLLVIIFPLGESELPS